MKLSAGTLAAGATAALFASPAAATEPASGSASAAAGRDFARPLPASGYAFRATGGELGPFEFQRRSVGPNDVAIDIRFCGVCHSDIHTGLGHWGDQRVPQITGHEIAGVVAAVGSAVSGFKVGDRVGVGCMVDSCGTCAECSRGFEQYCEPGATFTYGNPVDESVEPSGITQGGYSSVIVVQKDFVIRIPEGFELANAGPVMCAGVTVYSPLRNWNVRRGSRVGVVGLGGLGHMAVKIATAMGAEVVVFTTSAEKEADARRFGAADVVVNYDEAKMTGYRRHFDFILDAASSHHDLDPLVRTLKRDATLCMVGIADVAQSNQLSPFTTIVGRNAFAGSLIGSIRETQEVVDFCAANGITPEVTTIPLAQVNQAWTDVVEGRARYRYVIDMAMAG